MVSQFNQTWAFGTENALGPVLWALIRLLALKLKGCFVWAVATEQHRICFTNTPSYTRRFWFPLSRRWISSSEDFCRLISSMSNLWSPDFTWELLITINKVIFQIEIPTSIRLSAQSRLRFCSKQHKFQHIFSGNHIGDFYIVWILIAIWNLVHNNLTFHTMLSWHLLATSHTTLLYYHWFSQ